MLIRNGIDIIDIRRIKNALKKYDYRFKKRCFNDEEIRISDSRIKSAESYAKRYAAKEACAKALGTGLARGIFWKDIEIKNNFYGKPEIKLHGNSLKYLKKINKNNNFSIEVSLSDEKNYAIANVIIYGNEK